MKSYIINLDRSSERYSFVAKQFDGLGLVYERISAVDAQELDDKVKFKFCMQEGSVALSKPEIACFLSHRKCWELISEGDDKYASIFEDDIVLSSGSQPYLVNSNWITNDIDVIKIETYNDKTCLKRWGGSTVGSRKLFGLADFHTGSAGYIISKKYAQYLLCLTQNHIPCPVDHYLFNPRWSNFSQNNILQLVPAICIQDDRKSDFSELGETTISIRAVIAPVKDKNQSTLAKIRREILRPFKKMYRKLSRVYMVVPLR